MRTDKAGLEGQLRIREVRNGNLRTVAQRYTLNGIEWQRVELLVVAASTGARFDLNVVAWDFSPGQKLWVDDISLKKVAPEVEESDRRGSGGHDIPEQHDIHDHNVADRSADNHAGSPDNIDHHGSNLADHNVDDGCARSSPDRARCMEQLPARVGFMAGQAHAVRDTVR